VNVSPAIEPDDIAGKVKLTVFGTQTGAGSEIIIVGTAFTVTSILNGVPLHPFAYGVTTKRITPVVVPVLVSMPVENVALVVKAFAFVPRPVIVDPLTGTAAAQLYVVGVILEVIAVEAIDPPEHIAGIVGGVIIMLGLTVIVIVAVGPGQVPVFEVAETKY
jgi:hypothetical protein